MRPIDIAIGFSAVSWALPLGVQWGAAAPPITGQAPWVHPSPRWSVYVFVGPLLFYVAGRP